MAETMRYYTPSTFQNPTVFKFIGRWGPESGVDSFLCQLQAVMIQEGNISSVVLSAFMGLNALYILYNGPSSLATIKKYEWLAILIGFTSPLPFALVPLFMYGDAQNWCWFTKQNTLYGIYLWFMWLWILFAFNLVCLFFAMRHFSEKRAIALGSSVSVNKSQGSIKGEKASRSVTPLVKRLTAYMIAFVIVWTPSSINRIVNLATGDSYFILSLLQVIVSPTRGLYTNPQRSRGSAEGLSQESKTPSRRGSSDQLGPMSRRGSADQLGPMSRRGSQEIFHMRRTSQDPPNGKPQKKENKSAVMDSVDELN
ncbi:hypothetical protein EDD86DRAFT_246126 [Gorgonomyces haynaldii]|nr:hypothetical protein EDD86DRAFT_246126 [Gorgonomyces haynaldii]